MGSQTHLPGHDAIHGDSTYRSDLAVYLPATGALAAQSNVWWVNYGRAYIIHEGDAHSSLDNGGSINPVTSLPDLLASGGTRVAQVVGLTNLPSQIIVWVNIPAETAITYAG